MGLSLLYDLTVRAIIIVALTDALIFYVMSTRHITITWKFTALVIAVTLVLWRYGLLKTG
jgi:hypothetical protein